MKRIILAIIVALSIALPACAQFDFRTTGTRTQTYLVFKEAPSLPAVSPLNQALIVYDPACDCLKVSMNGQPFVTLVSSGGSGSTTVDSVFGRTGNVVAASGDYTATQVSASPFRTITATTVQGQLDQIDARISGNTVTSVFGRTGAITAQSGDYTATLVTSTASGDVAATTVQAAIAELASEKVNASTNTTISGLKVFSGYTSTPVIIQPASAPTANLKMFDVRTSAAVSKFSVDAEGDVIGSNATLGAITASSVTANSGGFSTDDDLTFSSNSGSAGAAGTIRRNSTNGLTLQGASTTGGTYDLSLTDPAGTVAFGVPNGTSYAMAPSRLGIGKSPSQPLHVDTGDAEFTISEGNDGNPYQHVGSLYTSTQVRFITAAQEAIRLSPTGTRTTFFGSVALGSAATATTPGAGDNDTSVATTAFVQSETLNQTEGDARYAQLGAANTLTADQTISHNSASGTSLFVTNTGASGRSWRVLSDADGLLKIRDQTGAANRMLFDSSGNVGIGVAPSVALHVEKAATNVLARIKATSLDSDAGLQLQNDARNWLLLVSGASGDSLKVTDSTAGADRLTIDSSGNVGVGTSTSVASLLEVQGSSPILTLTQTTAAASGQNTGAINFRHTDGRILGSVQGEILNASAGTGKLRFMVRNSANPPTEYLNITPTQATFAGPVAERGRSSPIGEWTSVAYNAANFTGNGTMTWTVDDLDEEVRYTLVGKTMTVTFKIDATDVGGTPNDSLQIAVPGGYTIAADTYNLIRYQDAGATATAGVVFAQATTTVVKLQKMSGAWTATSSDNTSVRGQITFPIQ